MTKRKDTSRQRHFQRRTSGDDAGVKTLSPGLPVCRVFVSHSIQRHVGGDWGDLEAKDRWANDLALIKHERLLTAYNDARFPQHGVATLWIITEADRSATTVLFPDEY